MTPKRIVIVGTVEPVLSDTTSRCVCCNHADKKHMYGLKYEDLKDAIYDELHRVAAGLHGKFNVTITLDTDE
jgi:hypothetical protein